MAISSHAVLAENVVTEVNKVTKPDSWVVKQPLTIAINETSFPYHSIDEQGNAIGLMADLWRLWAKNQQVEVKFVVLPWLETLSEVAKGKVDINGELSIIDSSLACVLLSLL